MNVIHSFYDTFRVFPGLITMEMFTSPVTTPKVRSCMVAGVFSLCILVYSTTANPLLALLVAFLLPEVLLRLSLAIC